MAKYVFLNLPSRGHVNPTLPIVEELVRREQEVSYYLTEEFREIVEATGATFQPYESKTTGVPASRSFHLSDPGSGIPAMLARMLEDTQYVPPQVIDRIRDFQPDAIIYGFGCTWAKPVLDELQVLAILTSATYASNERLNLTEHIKANMLNTPGMGERMRASMQAQDEAVRNLLSGFAKTFLRPKQLNIVFLPREFQPSVDTFDERYLFVGPSILPRHEASDFPFAQLRVEQPLLYISLGSILTNQPEFYRQCFAAFADQPWQVVLPIGKHTDLAALGGIPENFLLSRYAPQLEILPRTQIFVTHAGPNSVMESLYFGVPMVLIPHQAEQLLCAQRVVELGLGMMLDKETVNATALREAVEHVAQDPTYRQRAQDMQQLVRAAGGYQRAADAIIEFTRVRS